MLLRALAAGGPTAPPHAGSPPSPRLPAPRTPRSSTLTPGTAFDALYVYAAPGLIRQALLLTGCHRLALKSAHHAFHQAWEHWPEVARDTDPVGWVRVRTHTYALSPWHRFRRALPRQGPAVPQDPLLRVVLELPPRQRRALLLCDGLGLSPAEAAAETEAGTAATRSRLSHARTVLRELLPDRPWETVRQSFTAHLEDMPAPTASLSAPMREVSERRTRRLTRTVWVTVAALIGLIAFTIATTP